jgi:hypothetical protein
MAPNGPEWSRMAPNGPRGQWQDRNARLRKRGNRTIFPKQGQCRSAKTRLPTPLSLAARSSHFRQCQDHQARTNLGPLATKPTDDPRTAHRLVARSSHFRQSHDHRRRTNLGPSAASITVRPRRQPATPTSRHTSGRCYFRQQTDFGRTTPNLSTTDGPQITAAIAAASGKFGVRSPTRRTSPVMTNKRV